MMDMHGGSSEDMHSYHKSLIAGVITGCVVAVLLLVGIILCMWYRSRKKHGKKITLRQWCGACCGRKYAKTKHDGKNSGLSSSNAIGTGIGLMSVCPQVMLMHLHAHAAIHLHRLAR